MSDETKPTVPPRRYQVAVFGAGIAGLTAAHELVERGFEVEVYETEKPSVVDKLSGARCAIGGMARTQWARAERPPDNQPSASRLQAAEPLELFIEQRIKFTYGSDTISDEERAQIVRVATDLKNHPEVRCVEVRGFGDTRGHNPYPDDTTDRIDFDRAKAVAAELEKQLHDVGAEKKTITTAAMGLGYRDDWSRDDADRNYVSFRIVEDWIPGEHGFRFFPSFYRNLFDTMRRTPIPEDKPVYEETPRTVLDNLVPTTFLGISTDQSTKPFGLRRRPVISLRELFDQLSGMMRAFGLSLADVGRFQLKMFQYMTSCVRRRQEQLERKSWADFLEAETFSPAFRKYLESTAQSLVAMTATRSDARTYGNISVQMLQDHFGALRTDATLNGPTTLAWFDHWRRYLECQGVRFHHATLAGFAFDAGGRPWPVVKMEESDKLVMLGRDYHVLALSAPEIERLAKQHPELKGDDFESVRTFPWGKPTEKHTGGALEHMAGVQYYFENDFKFIEGHIIYPDSPWRLSAVSQPQYWLQKRGWWSGYRGVLSVDISNWHSEDRAAWDATKQQVAEQAWLQIKHSLEHDADPPHEATSVPDPILYHLDENVEFERNPPAGGASGKLPSLNKTPLLINRPGEYARRPGRLHPTKGYALQPGNLVLAGTYMQTYTRLTTMEAANESGRHAVNGILSAARDPCSSARPYPAERCSIADPEAHEPDDLKFLVELDEQLYEHRLPHFVDILELREVPRALLRPAPDMSALGLRERIASLTATRPGTP